MANVVVVGSQWGDEGKGKIVDWLSSRADVVVRFQMPKEIISSSVVLAAQRAGVGPDGLVGLRHVALQAVELGERLAARRAIIHDP